MFATLQFHPIHMAPGYTIDIYNHGHVTLLDFLGDDIRIAETARTSYRNKEIKSEEENKKLIKYLFLNRHTSPFEQCNISFEIKMPIFCMRQFVRHRTFRLNEWSGRYSELPDENYYPAVWRRQLPKGKNKQGSEKDYDKQWNSYNNAVTATAFEHCRLAYSQLLERGVAKELARIVLPLAIFTQIHVNCDLHNLLHFLYLRTDEHAQLELQELALAMLQIVEDLFPITCELFQYYKPEMMIREQFTVKDIWVTR